MNYSAALSVTFALGMVTGAVLMSLIVPFTNSGINGKIRQEAVDNGVADWKVTTNGTVYFEWRKN